MSSFLSDSAIGLGGNDFGGSIEQPMMDREVISIGGSSSNDTHRSASDSESYSLERVRASCLTSGGTSHLCRNAQCSVAAREPVLVTMILPPSASRGVRRGSSGGDVKASPRVQRSHRVGSSSSTPAVAGCGWVRDDVLKYKSSLTLVVSVDALQCQVKLASPEDSCKIFIQTCGSDDFLFLRVTSGSLPLFFMYRCLFEVLGLIRPLAVFQYAMLEHLNVALS